MSRLIVDSWLELRFADVESGQNQLLRAVKLRRQWLALLNLKLENAVDSIKNDKKAKAEQQELEAALSRGLVEFLHNETVYSIKRLLPADIKVAYVGRNMGGFDNLKNPFDKTTEPVRHPEKGGMIMTENVTYNCLAGDLTAVEETLWKCPFCQVNFLKINFVTQKLIV